MTVVRLDLRRFKFCQHCGCLRQFVAGECVMSPWHLRPCDGCGRPVSGTTSCSACDEQGAAGAAVDAAMEARDDARDDAWTEDCW